MLSMFPVEKASMFIEELDLRIEQGGIRHYPAHNGTHIRWPWAEMRINDWVVVPAEHLVNSATASSYQYAKRTNKRFTRYRDSKLGAIIYRDQ